MKIYQFTKALSATEAQKIKFWMNFLNNPFYPSSHKTKEQFKNLCELLARGNFSKEATLISRDFSKGVWKYLCEKGAVEEQGPLEG